MYYYEHTDGSTISKPDIVVDMAGGPDDYFDSPFVVRWWYYDEDDEHGVVSQDV